MTFANKIPADYVESIDISRVYSNIKSSIRWGEIEWVNGSRVSYLQTYSNPSELREKYVKFIYDSFSKEIDGWISHDYLVQLQTTKCNYGGVRYWFECPSCICRVGILYLRGPTLMCRRCSNLTYESNLLSGKSKFEGRTVSGQELDNLKARVKRRFYAGKQTRIYKRYLKKVARMLTSLHHLGIYPSQLDLETLV